MRALLSLLHALTTALRFRLIYWHHARADHHLDRAEHHEAAVRSERAKS